MEILPEEGEKLRACLLCSLIKGADQFRENGCENCEDLLQIHGSVDRVFECTSSSFYGSIALMRPHESWVSRWQRISKNVPGIYAIRVNGRLPDEIVNILEDKGITYRSRDGNEELQ